MPERIAYTAPLFCSLNITGQCNLRCLHCSAAPEEGLDKEMTSEQLLGLVRYLTDKAQLFEIGISGGEPLLCKDLFAIFEMLSSRNVVGRLFTNATLITPAIADRLAEEPCLARTVNSSLDGPCGEIHDAFRGVPGAFDMAVAGITRLVERDVSINVVCTVNTLNVKHLREVACLATELGIKNLSFGCASLVGRGRQNRDVLVLSKQELDDACDTVLALRQECSVVNGGSLLEWPKVFRDSCQPGQAGCGRKVAQCDICKESVAIRPDGWVVPCNKFWGYKIGNVLNEDFLDIYQKSAAAVAVRDLTKLRSHELPGCEDCQYSSHCSGGCRAEGYASGGSLTSPGQFHCLRRYMEADDARGLAVAGEGL